MALWGGQGGRLGAGQAEVAPAARPTRTQACPFPVASAQGSREVLVRGTYKAGCWSREAAQPLPAPSCWLCLSGSDPGAGSGSIWLRRAGELGQQLHYLCLTPPPRAHGGDGPIPGTIGSWA